VARPPDRSTLRRGTAWCEYFAPSSGRMLFSQIDPPDSSARIGSARRDSNLQLPPNLCRKGVGAGTGALLIPVQFRDQRR
jgi:hypothetical protein